jgi:hypothetical protein
MTQRFFYPLSQQGKIIVIDRTPLAGLTNAGHNFLAAKGFGGTRSLNNVQQRSLLGGKPRPTLRTFPTAANLSAIFNLARIDNARIIMSAKWADHAACHPSLSTSGV